MPASGGHDHRGSPTGCAVKLPQIANQGSIFKNPAPRLYDDLAHLWPLISPRADYVAEAQFICELLKGALDEPEGTLPAVLELGAGAGHTLVHLADGYDTTALDLSPRMIELCRGTSPRTQVHVADMRSARLGRGFSVVLAHDAVEYMLTVEDIEAACATAAAHLEPGGVFYVGPTYLTETFQDHDSAGDAAADGHVEVRYVSYVRRTAADRYELIMVLAIRECGAIRFVEDRHLCGLFDAETWRAALHGAGFAIEQEWNAGAGSRTTDRIPHSAFVARRT
ncbi:MAG: hypothetical protein CMJ18_12860 [Phycisphaeraceae bacterium]|nr:hypothetical protein [Phycisphaeraceae bacterium]